MGLSRLDNFLKSTRGTVLYVDPNSLDATDSIENLGNSLTRPFKTIQRALIEAARFSYQQGFNNDRFGKTTIMLYPGEHIVDNRPGWIPNASSFVLRDGTTSTDFTAWNNITNFDLTTSNNALYKLNSIHGGVIIPRGCSIVGMDLRKTKIRPTYVPNPANDSIERSAIFRVTGGCYFWQFSIFDADPNSICFKDYTSNTFLPNFSHHKLSVFEYADGYNPVYIADDFLAYSDTRTDLDMYYEKVGIVYGQATGRAITPDYPSTLVDIQPVIDEYQIVGSRGSTVGITSIISGDGVNATTTITVTTDTALPAINVDTPIQILGVGSPGYDGQYVINQVVNPYTIKYLVPTVPTVARPSSLGATLNIAVDTVNSSSPYIFNVSLRSVYGMCGINADGSKATGFKSMVVAQFTGIGLQKDDNAFVRYNYSTGQYEDSTSIVNLHSDSKAVFKPSYENFHIKASNNAYLQLVSVFAIGFANHFVVESGGDFSINNSNSNFGSKSLVASGFRDNSFPQDDIGYVTHIIPPKQIEASEVNLEYDAIDVALTVGVGNTSRLYLYGENNFGDPPPAVIDGYRIGARSNEKIYVQVSQGGETQTYSSRIIMPDTAFTYVQTSSQKIAFVNKQSVTNLVGLGNSISNNVITFSYPHQFLNGESIRILSDDGHLPDGITPNEVYYAITTGLNIDQIKVAQTLSDAINGQAIDINAQGGNLYVVSRVSDKNSGDYGHPVQWDATNNNWYINVSTVAENEIYSLITNLGVANLGNATPRTYIKRVPDSRGLIDTIYRLRYVIPKDSSVTARPPLDGYILQVSNNVIGAGTSEIQKYFNPNNATLSRSTDLRNPSFISGAFWYGGYAFINTELPHRLSLGSIVQISNVKSTGNPTGTYGLGFNNVFQVVQISNAKQFTVILTIPPGTFTNNTSSRDSSLPYFQRKSTYGTYQIYRSSEIKKYIPSIQDGVYHLIITNSSNSPTVTPFNNLKFSQPIQNLYPQTNRDNPSSDPNPSQCYAVSDQIGRVVINDPQNSISKESLARGLYDVNVAFAITDISTKTTYNDHIFYTAIDHGLSGITSVSILSGGSSYVPGTYYNASLVGIGTSVTGSNASALVVVNASGNVSNVQIMDGGSAYGIGNTLSVTGIGTAGSPGSGAVVQVTSIIDPTNDTLSILGISSFAFLNYNTLYRITGVDVGKPKEINVKSSEIITGITTLVLGTGVVQTAGVSNAGKSIGVSSLTYDRITGISTLNFTNAHGFKVDNKIRLSGCDDTFFESKDYIVKRVNNLSSISINTGITTVAVSTGGTSIYALRHSFSSYGGDVDTDNENTSGRIIPAYGGSTTLLTQTVLSTTSDSVAFVITDAVQSGLKIGDYLSINDEIVRIRQNVTGDAVYVFRAVLGSLRQTHQAGSVVRRIYVPPFEFRRNSIIRASGHTFEYMGFGPGNYSTAFPEKQNRILSAQEELLAQSSKINGGISIYTGMDSKGNFFTGNKKINSATGQEEVYDSPIPTVTGEDPGQKNLNVGFDVLTPLEISVSRSLRVEGGPNKNLISQFDGPVIFNEKITSNAAKGIEATSLLLQGNATISRKYTVGISTPIFSGNSGDVVYTASPDSGGTLGWVYTRQNRWEKFGRIFNNGIDGVGVSSAGINTNTSSLIDFVGIGLSVSTIATPTGVTTVVINGALPFGNVLGIGTGSVESGITTYIGIATQINFVGSGMTVTASPAVNGIATVTFERSLPDIFAASKFIKVGAAATNFLKADGSDALITFAEVTDALGFIPANASSIPSGNYPQGNSLVLDDFNLPAQGGPFNGNKTDFSVNINGIAYTTPGTAANLIISIGGVIQKPGTDYLIVPSGTGANTNTIRFTTAPATGTQNFGVALGGQGSLVSDPIWDNKGDLIVGISNNLSASLPLGTNNQILTVDTSTTRGIRWSSALNITTVNVGTSLTVGSAATFTSTGLNFNTGIITARTFIGNLTGTASTASIATTSFGLTGNPIINVSGVTCTNGSGIITATSYRVGTSLTITSSGINVNTGVVTARTFIGNGTIPVGGIIMWSGTIAGIPTGWALCDGTNSTPDLRNRFIVGAGSDTDTYSIGIGSAISPSGQIGVGSTGGYDSTILDVENLPPHNHGINYAQGYNIAFGSNVGIPLEINDGTSLPLQGSGNAFDTRPPYYALAFIMRTI
jgi:hypothetical protein